MSLASLAGWVLQVLTMVLVFYMIYADSRYALKRRRSRNWPTTTGRIDDGIVGFRGPLSGLPRVLYRVHFTYSYCVHGLQHTGKFFVLSNGKQAGERLRQELVGKNVFVKYDDNKPEVALLVDDELAGKRVVQGPGWTYK